MGKLIIDGNSVYEVDEECLKKKKIPAECGVTQALAKKEKQSQGGNVKHIIK